MNEEKEVLAIMREVGYGCRDVGRPVLFFSAYTGECCAALQVLEQKEAFDLIKAYGVYDVHDLSGKACWVKESPGRIMYSRPAIIGGNK